MALQEFKCPNCGGALQYSPGVNELACPYCDSIVDIEALKDMDEELSRKQGSEAINWGYEGGEWGEGEQPGMAVYSCKSCGGEIFGDETLGATKCPFCDNSVVMTSKFSGALRPDMMIPFKYGREAALESMQKHYMGKALLPKVFKDKNHLEEIKGVYIPFWLFDADMEAHMEYSATKNRFWSDSRYNYHETSYYRVIRDGGINFSKVPVDGSAAMDDALMESIEPFSHDGAVDFNTAYLAGYYANKYDVGSEEGSVRANERIRNSTVSAFADTVSGYSSVSQTGENIRLINGGVRYALLPVWLLSTKWQDRSFVFAMNGQTGKFVGDLPLDKAAYGMWLLKIFGVVAAAALLISQTVVSLIP